MLPGERGRPVNQTWRSSGQWRFLGYRRFHFFLWQGEDFLGARLLGVIRALNVIFRLRLADGSQANRTEVRRRDHGHDWLVWTAFLCQFGPEIGIRVMTTHLGFAADGDIHPRQIQGS